MKAQSEDPSIFKIITEKLVLSTYLVLQEQWISLQQQLEDKKKQNKLSWGKMFAILFYNHFSISIVDLLSIVLLVTVLSL